MQFLHDEYGMNVSQIDLVSLHSNASSSMPYLTKILNKLRFWMFHVDSILGQKMNKKIWTWRYNHYFSRSFLWHTEEARQTTLNPWFWKLVFLTAGSSAPSTDETIFRIYSMSCVHIANKIFQLLTTFLKNDFFVFHYLPLFFSLL